MYKMLVNKKQVGETVVTNHSMTEEEIVCFALGLDDIENQEALEKLYHEGCPAVCFEDNYFIPYWDFEIVVE